MPTLIMTTLAGKIDGSVKAKAMTFLEKLGADDTTPGLHIEKIHAAVDDRVRTGRVDQFWRAVLFRLDNDHEVYYVVHGIWPHDKANAIAEKVRLKINPVNGLPQFEETALPAPVEAVAAPSPAVAEPALLVQWGRTTGELVDVLGLPNDVAERALGAPDEDALLALAEEHEATWMGLILVALAAGDGIESIVEQMQLDEPAAGDDDAAVIESLQRPAARSQFAIIDGQDELRRVIEGGDFEAWRVFLHPEQRRWVEIDTSGAFRLSGGAGTGKTVVLVHRAVRLAQADATSRIVLTTYTTNLAASLRDMVDRLDPGIGKDAGLGHVGVHVSGIDALASDVVKSAGPDIAKAVQTVLGEPRSAPASRVTSGRWGDVLESTATGLGPDIANETFLAAEYELIVLPNRITQEAQYLKVRRAGRGVSLDRAKRSAVWNYIRAYRALNSVDGSLDFAEAAAVAAEHLATSGEPPADHVLVDEGQDLTPTQLQLVRALAGEGRNDLFLAEDSHQRIYGPKVVLSRYGINIRGRSRRLTLNYRTTAQNLRWAMGVLEGVEYVDIEDEPESTGYRSARTGPSPVERFVSSLEAELQEVVDRVRAWTTGGADAGTIAVLVPDRWQRDRVAKRLAESDLPSFSVDRAAPPSNRILVMTRHRAKGMEFSKVVMTDVGYLSPSEQARHDALDPSERADLELRRRSLDYVAATRARDELMIVRRT